MDERWKVEVPTSGSCKISAHDKDKECKRTGIRREGENMPHEVTFRTTTESLAGRSERADSMSKYSDNEQDLYHASVRDFSRTLKPVDAGGNPRGAGRHSSRRCNGRFWFA